jgi:hypothetical protein
MTNSMSGTPTVSCFAPSRLFPVIVIGGLVVDKSLISEEKS